MACERWWFAWCSVNLFLAAVGFSLLIPEAEASHRSGGGGGPNPGRQDIPLKPHENEASYYEYNDVSRTRGSYGEPSWVSFESVPRSRRSPEESTLVTSSVPPPSDVGTNSSPTPNVTYSTENATTNPSTPLSPAPNPPLPAGPTYNKPEEAKSKKNTTFIVSQPLNPATGKAVPVTVWANRTMWTNVTEENKKKFAEGATVDGVDPESDDITITKFNDLTNKTLSMNNITKTEEDTHQYYNSTFIVDEAVGRSYWVDMDNHPNLKVNELLSQSHRRAATVKLSFDFPFYGHMVRNVTIATGGFLYTGEYVHSWLAATQYIAPLMANFDTRLSNISYVKYADNGTAFTVEWENVYLQEKPKAGPFTFQATLHKNGDIVFVYSSVPVMVETIEDNLHPVKVGLSDAYIIDRTIFFVRRKTIYEYHRVNFNRQDIKRWTTIYLRALPTCLGMLNCSSCLTNPTEFECKWCPLTNRCSTGTDRYRQEWLMKGCETRNVKEEGSCPTTATTYAENPSMNFYPGQGHSDEEMSASVEPSQQAKALGPPEHAPDNMKMGVSGIIGILLVVALVAGLVAWAAYAYRNPHTASGQMLIRYRPSQWSWRRGEARYTAATIHM